MRKAMIKTGDKYNRLTAVKFSHYNKYKNQHWLFQCECGNTKISRVSSVKNGRIKSCGCLKVKHGMCYTRTYNSWHSMIQRCLNSRVKAYKNYGGRGITVCPEWLTFKSFYADMGDRPRGMTLDRKDNNKGYCKSNCRWATPTEQNNNRR